MDAAKTTARFDAVVVVVQTAIQPAMDSWLDAVAKTDPDMHATPELISYSMIELVLQAFVLRCVESDC